MSAVFSRYARALTDVVFDMKLDATRIVDEVYAISTVFQENSELRSVWASPAIPAEQKRNLLDSIAAKMGVSKPVRNFIAVLIDNHRVAALPEIARQFETELLQRLGMADVDITSSRELNADERRQMEAEVERMTGKKVRARYAIDRTLLGGAVVRMGSTIYDGSVRGQLQRIKEQLTAS
jgi:F-type H+-transporting ATPase subunit delta